MGDPLIKISRLVAWAIEAVILVMVCLAPWALGSGEPEARLVIAVGIGVVLCLWAIRMLLERAFRWKRCPVVLCLAVLYLCGIVQLIPLPARLLRTLSPATSQLYEELLPTTSEVLPLGEERPSVVPRPGSTLSVYPGATRSKVADVLSVFLLFAVIRNNIPAGPGLKRLAIAAIINGTLLAFFGLVHFFTSAPGQVYWTIQTMGEVFGPFINRNHFAFYINLCIGLGLGLLWMNLHRRPSESRRSTRRSAEAVEIDFSQWLHDPRSLWTSAAIALMVSSLLLSFSRGAFLAFLGSSLVGLALWIRKPSSFGRLISVCFVVAVTLGLLVWFGYDRVQARLHTIWTGDAIESRWDLWRRVWPLVWKYPIFGTGLGTFSVVEAPCRTSGEDGNVTYYNAHNEYLEALIEGGILRLAVSLTAIGLVFWLGLRASSRYRHAALGGLVNGAIFAFSTAVFHSFGEFAIHMPAVALLLTVLCAHLCGLGNSNGNPQPDEKETRNETEDRVFTLRLFGIAPVVGSIVAVLLGASVAHVAWRAARSDGLRQRARRLSDEPDHRDTVISYLTAAASVTPDYARLHTELANSYLEVYEERGELLEDQELGDDERLERESALKRNYLVPALRHYLLARDLCPLLGIPHLQLANLASEMSQADPSNRYLDRAKQLIPFDPQLWYLFGVYELFDEEKEQAWASWRRSLELSDVYLPEILHVAHTLISPGELIDNILPDKPDLLLRAALQLYPQPEASAEREPFIAKALALLNRLEPELKSTELHLRATIHRSLNQPQEAIANYEAALAVEPGQLTWRYEFAELLHQQGQLDRAHRELLTILRQQHNHMPARALSDIVARQIAEKM